MQKCIMMWYANINHHKHIISLSHLLDQEVKLPLSFRRDGREVKNIALCLDITALLKTLFSSLKHIFQPINRHTIRLLRNAEICIFLKELFIVPLLRWNVYTPIIQLPKSNITFSHSMRNPGIMFCDETICRGFFIPF